MSAEHGKQPVATPTSFITSIGNRVKAVLSDGNTASDIDVRDETEELQASGFSGSIVSVGPLQSATLEQLNIASTKVSAAKVLIVGEFCVKVIAQDAKKSDPSTKAASFRAPSWTIPAVSILLSALLIAVIALLWRLLSGQLSVLQGNFQLLKDQWT